MKNTNDMTDTDWIDLLSRTAEEYESAAEYAVKHSGELPPLLSDDCMVAIDVDREGFKRCIQGYRYAIAMSESIKDSLELTAFNTLTDGTIHA